MSKINSRRRRKRLRSIYTSATLCVAAVAIALGAAAIRIKKDDSVSVEDTSSNTSSTTSGDSTAETSRRDEQSQSETDGEVSSEETVQASATPSSEDDDGDDGSSSEVDEYEDYEDSERTLAIQVTASADSYTRPVSGAVTKEYSIQNLVYSKTMGDWRVHTGLDLSAEEGEVVKSAAAGTVTGIVEDALYGTTVVVNQTDGLMVYYCGLNSDTAVSEGDNVSAGATLGTISGVPCESADGIHLHIEVKKESQYLNPADALGYK